MLGNKLAIACQYVQDGFGQGVQREPVSAVSSSRNSVITLRPLNDASARLESIDRYLYTLQTLFTNLLSYM